MERRLRRRPRRVGHAQSDLSCARPERHEYQWRTLVGDPDVAGGLGVLGVPPRWRDAGSAIKRRSGPDVAGPREQISIVRVVRDRSARGAEARSPRCSRSLCLPKTPSGLLLQDLHASSIGASAGVIFPPSSPTPAPPRSRGGVEAVFAVVAVGQTHMRHLRRATMGWKDR